MYIAQALVGVLLVAVAAAGCLGAEPGEPGDPTPTPPTSSATTTTLSAPPDGAPPLWSEPWQASDCLQVWASIPFMRDWLDANLPPPYEPSAGVSAALGILFANCATLIIGNHTIIEPFHIGFVYAAVLPTDANHSRSEAFVFETITDNPVLAAAMRDYGWPVEAGTIAVSDGPARTAIVATSNGEYAATVGHVELVEDAHESYEYLWHAGPPAESNLLLDMTETFDATLLEPTLVIADGGTLGDAFGGVPRPGTAASETFDLTFTFRP
jgi:hypothetical protein